MVLSHIFHISDIHIRNGDAKQCRYTEYKQVFENLFTSLQVQIRKLKLKKTDYIIVLSGDIFHNKNVIGNYGLSLYKQLVNGLTSIGHTILFHGNHDRNQNEIEQPSLISSTLQISNLKLLDQSTTFIIDDIGFSYLSIDDTLDTTDTSGRITVLPSFPIIKENVKCKIALFHGTFANVKLYNGTEIMETQNPYPFAMIESFDYALLGDIHLRQKGLYGKTLWGYAGSLIQQNFGEDIVKHGYLIWDLNAKTVTEIDVYNKIGMLNIKTINDEIHFRSSGRYLHFEKFLTTNLQSFPKHIDIKLHSEINLHQLLNILATYNITCDILNKSTISDTICYNESNYLDIDIRIDKDTILQHFSNQLSTNQNIIMSKIMNSYDNLLIDITQYPDDLHKECMNKNASITTSIGNCLDIDKPNHKQSFTIKYLEWKNLYCYEDTQWIDFEQSKHSIFLVAGNNGTGKSAIYDILTLAIWGQITKEKQSSLTGGIIHNNQDSASTIIDISIGNTIYRITRAFNRSGTNLHKSHCYLYKHLDNNHMILEKKDNACNIEIEKIFGKLEDFLSSSMITQNIDFDILKLDYKDTLAVIDKTFDIQYIYNLYDLFKNSLHKYKDLKKVIDNKQEVYERLIATSISIDDTELDAQEKELQYLKIQKESLENENNCIALDINDPENQTILETDYANIELPKLQTEDEFIQAYNIFNEQKIILKGLSIDDIHQLKEQHGSENLCLSEIQKPCEYNLIQSEENALKSYNVMFEDKTLTELQVWHNELLQDYDSIINQLSDHNKARPVTGSKPTFDESIIIDNVGSIGLTILEKYCMTSDRLCTKPLHVLNTKLDITEHNMNMEQLELIQTEIVEYQKQLLNIDIEIKTLCHSKNELKQVNKPSTQIDMHTSTCLLNYLSKYNKQLLQDSINKDNDIMELFYTGLDKLKELQNELHSYNIELNNLINNEEYAYNPICEYCCKRSWVCRMNELRIIISSLEKNIANHKKVLYDDTEYDYIQVFVRLENNRELLNSLNLNKEWYDYYVYKEENDNISLKLTELLNTKECIVGKIDDANMKIYKLIEDTNAFKYTCFDLYDKWCNIQAYNKFTKWQTLNNNLINKKEYIEKTLKCIENEITTRPRMQRLIELKSKYNEWAIYDLSYKSLAAHKWCILNEEISSYESYKINTKRMILKPLIIKKQQLMPAIKDLDERIMTLNDNIVKTRTLAVYNKQNNSNLQMLQKCGQDLQEFINTLDIIVSKFKDYRKELYDTVILRKLVDNANKYIKTMCHTNSKIFEIDYLVTEHLNMLHINWLIKNTTDDQKQISSMKLASGFQKFAATMALRMVLFGNKQCTQLFIDEGFTACDKQNLAIVPSFLKNLLKSYSSIIIVSHIDIIQECTDSISTIKYDNIKNKSSIHYGEQQEMHIKKRNNK
jgi:DNA repair exonuclease SbcCD ATPase subunit/DNA repair exonuclease SbcCD nuclease subunit